MNPVLKYGDEVINTQTGTKGRLLGPFRRKGEQWWTVCWEDDTTTSEKEQELLGE